MRSLGAKEIVEDGKKSSPLAFPRSEHIVHVEKTILDR